MSPQPMTIPSPARHSIDPITETLAKLAYREGEGLEVEISYRRLAALTGRSRNTCNTAVRRLVEAEELSVLHPGTGSGYPTVYRVAPDGAIAQAMT